MNEDRIPTNPALFGDAIRKLLRSTPVRALMGSPVAVAELTMTRAQAGELMSRTEVSALPVVDAEGTVVGMISKTDVVREDYGDARWEGAAGQVGKFMTPFALGVSADDSLAVAIEHMLGSAVHHLPVINERRRAVGMLSTFDLVRWLARYLEGEESTGADEI